MNIELIKNVFSGGEAESVVKKNISVIVESKASLSLFLLSHFFAVCVLALSCENGDAQLRNIQSANSS
jgi:hypothetical protein